ncbi:MAG: hypothetical protein NUW14_00885 [Deltaproteobacteria bacterium]|nr:hypothetical protein [Deltaproteobacteria bacterium]
MPVFWGILSLAAANCHGIEKESGGLHRPAGEETKMSAQAELERLLADGDFRAVEVAASMGDAAVPALRKGAGMPAYRSRQVAVACAGRVGGEAAGEILSLGLKDGNVNVRVAAAGQLSVNPPESAKDAVLSTLVRSTETDVREMLAFSAGYFPGERTVAILRSIASGKEVLSSNARMALARLGDPAGREAVLNDLASSDPLVRYETVGGLRYVNDPSLAIRVKPLLLDTEEAQAIGPGGGWKYRRVCDQAVDTLIYLLKLKLPFPTGEETIYGEEQLLRVRDLTR